MDREHQSAPMTEKLLEKDRSRDDKSRSSVAYASEGNGLVEGGFTVDLTPSLVAERASILGNDDVDEATSTTVSGFLMLHSSVFRGYRRRSGRLTIRER